MERGQLEHSRGHVPGGNWATVEFDSPLVRLGGCILGAGGAFWEAIEGLE